MFLVWWVIRLIKQHRDDLAVKDAKLEEANAKLVDAFKTVIPVVADLKDMAIDWSVHARRTVK